MSTTQWEAVLTMPVDEDRDHIQGLVDAPVTLVQYGDYECPYCGEAYPIVKEVQARMGERLRFVFRNFPISTSHPHAERIHEDFLSGVRSGVNGTPTFFINGARHDGSYELEPLLRALERAGASERGTR